MIHHVSIPAHEPRHVAEVLAELMGGECHSFGPLEGAFMAKSGDAYGTMIEVYPERATLDIPATDDQVVFGENKAPPNTWPFHVLLSVPLEPDEIERIGAREGWRAKTFGRGMRGQKPFFHVIEFWLENRLMIEVVSPAMAREYEDFMKNAQLSVMNDPESLRLLRATHVKRAGLTRRQRKDRPCQDTGGTEDANRPGAVRGRGGRRRQEAELVMRTRRPRRTGDPD